MEYLQTDKTHWSKLRLSQEAQTSRTVSIPDPVSVNLCLFPLSGLFSAAVGGATEELSCRAINQPHETRPAAGLKTRPG